MVFPETSMVVVFFGMFTEVPTFTTLPSLINKVALFKTSVGET